jgi:hypothetical protein
VYCAVLLFTQADLLGRAESLAAHALGNLLDFAAGLEESSNLALLCCWMLLHAWRPLTCRKLTWPGIVQEILDNCLANIPQE